jgi:meso-butanediol dehydrogenase/(S,S)-butanediol dehydrogenase/diacetyl reductase
MSKAIVITGAGAGLGLTLARDFVADGHDVILVGRTYSKVQEAAESLGSRAMAVQCDVASPDSVRRAFAAIVGRFPQIDVLINNAAIFIPSTVAEASDDLILQTININLTGAILMCRAAIPMLSAGGHIINVTSESIELPYAHLALYQASKAGLERFTLSLHRELEEAGLRASFLRAGTMMGDQKEMQGDPKAWARFFEACQARGLNLVGRPVTQFTSVASIFRALIDLPPDLHAVSVALHGRTPELP